MQRLFGTFAIFLLITVTILAQTRDEATTFRRAAFVSDRTGISQIYTSDPDGNLIQQMTHFRNRSQDSPLWSADGRFLAFTSAIGETVEVYLTDVLGRRPHKVANNIFIHPVWGGNTLVLTDVESDFSSAALKRIDNGRVTTIAADVDIQFVAYADWVVYTAGNEVYRHHLPSRQTEQLSVDVERLAVWALYRDQLAYLKDNQIYINDGDGILPEPASIEEIRWSPDGEWLYFEDNTNGRRSIYRIRPNGAGLERLTDDRTCQFIRDFSADGQYLLYVQTRCSGFVMDVHTLNVESREDTYNFTIDNTFQRMPRWTNDGRLSFEELHSAVGTVDLMLYDPASSETTIFARNTSTERLLSFSPNLKFAAWNMLPLLIAGLVLLVGYDIIRIIVSRYSGWRRN